MKCKACRGTMVVVTETDYRFWATRFGVKIPEGTTTMEALAASGLPEDLAALAVDWAISSEGLP